MSRVQRRLVFVAAIALVLAACGGSDTSVTTSASTSSTVAPQSSTTQAGRGTTGPTVDLPTTSLPCQTLPIPPTPVKSPAAAQSVLLTKVTEQGDGCVDHVIFDFTGKGSDPPGYTITYGTPPFVMDGSGSPVTVPGTAFIVVKVQPGYGYDFEAGTPTYTGSKSIAVTGASNVQGIVETGDFEGVLTWVIGTSGKRPFAVQATGAPRHQLVVSVG
jgi:hypothetical protein